MCCELLLSLISLWYSIANKTQTQLILFVRKTSLICTCRWLRTRDAYRQNNRVITAPFYILHLSAITSWLIISGVMKNFVRSCSMNNHGENCFIHDVPEDNEDAPVKTCATTCDYDRCNTAHQITATLSSYQILLISIITYYMSVMFRIRDTYSLS